METMLAVRSALRLYIWVEVALLAVTAVAYLGHRSPEHALFSVMAMTAVALGLLVATEVPSVRRRPAYLPAALVVLLVLPVLGQGMALLDGERAYQKAVLELSLLSLVPLVLVAWRTSFRVVVAAALLVALVETAFLMASSLAKDQVEVALHVLWGRTIGMVFAGYVIARLAGEQRGQHRELLAAHGRLKANAISLERLAISRERNRLARELHDTLAHTLSGIAVQLAAARALLGDDAAQAGTRIEATRQQAREGLHELRRAMHDLRSSPLEELGLSLALARLLSALEQRAGINVKTDWPARPVALPGEVEHGVYRIAEEALQNIERHAAARTVRLQLECDEVWLGLVITDDGCGFDQKAVAADRYGIQGMRERAGLLGATLVLKSAPGQGCSLGLRVPMADGQAGGQSP